MASFFLWEFSLPSTAVQLAGLVNTFFLFSFLGWVMECIVISIQDKHFTLNRGFVHGPFCIIYGFGSMLGYLIMKPFSFNYVLLFCIGAVLATAFEFLTAKLMLKFLGNLWWDYSKKPFNYKGILCLESTLFWGVVSVSLFAFLYDGVCSLATKIPPFLATKIAFLLVAYYAVDFAVSIYHSLCAKSEEEQQTEKEDIA
ncbi:MAG: putative ABC transporter permease [Oscillospiraceae bacterium]